MGFVLSLKNKGLCSDCLAAPFDTAYEWGDNSNFGNNPLPHFVNDQKRTSSVMITARSSQNCLPFLTGHLEIAQIQAPLARIGVFKKSLTADRSCAGKGSQAQN